MPVQVTCDNYACKHNNDGSCNKEDFITLTKRGCATGPNRPHPAPAKELTQAIDAVFERLEKLSPEEFKAEIENHKSGSWAKALQYAFYPDGIPAPAEGMDCKQVATDIYATLINRGEDIGNGAIAIIAEHIKQALAKEEGK
jgi:hypothetical protein